MTSWIRLYTKKRHVLKFADFCQVCMAEVHIKFKYGAFCTFMHLISLTGR